MDVSNALNQATLHQLTFDMKIFQNLYKKLFVSKALTQHRRITEMKNLQSTGAVANQAHYKFIHNFREHMSFTSILSQNNLITQIQHNNHLNQHNKHLKYSN